MDDEDFQWLQQELQITAERAEERGMTVYDFVVGINAWAHWAMHAYHMAADEIESGIETGTYGYGESGYSGSYGGEGGEDAGD